MARPPQRRRSEALKRYFPKESARMRMPALAKIFSNVNQEQKVHNKRQLNVSARKVFAPKLIYLQRALSNIAALVGEKTRVGSALRLMQISCPRSDLSRKLPRENSLTII